MDKLGAMKAFARIVEAGTFTKAADSLAMQKGQVTRLVQLLEQELETKLLNRTTRRVTITADGAAYYDRVVRLLDEIEEIESAMTYAKARPKGRLRIHVPSTIADFILLPAMEDFCLRYPDIQIDIGTGDKPVDLIGENVDCALRAGMGTDLSLVARRIGDINTTMCASTTYLGRFGVPQHPSDLECDHHRVIAYFSKGSARRCCVLHRGDEQYEVNARCMVAVNDYGAMLTAALAGLGIARTAPFMEAPYMVAGTLQVVLPEWSAGVVPIHVVYPPSRHVSAKLRVFIDWAAELFARKLKTSPRAHDATFSLMSARAPEIRLDATARRGMNSAA